MQLYRWNGAGGQTYLMLIRVLHILKHRWWWWWWWWWWWRRRWWWDDAASIDGFWNGLTVGNSNKYPPTQRKKKFQVSLWPGFDCWGCFFVDSTKSRWKRCRHSLLGKFGNSKHQPSGQMESSFANLHVGPYEGDTISLPKFTSKLRGREPWVQTSIFLVAHCGSGMSNSVVFRMDIEFWSWKMLDFVSKTQNFLTKLRPFGNQMNPVNKFTSGNSGCKRS